MSRSERKDAHVKHALNQVISHNDFDRIQLVHQSLPDFDLDEVDLSTDYLGYHFDYPIYINAMTGGSEKTKKINHDLAQLAKKYHLAMSVGSQHVALDDAQYEASFKVIREVNPDGFVIGNLNANATLEEAKRAIEMIDANALGIHINTAQELTMDEGDRHFKHWSKHIETIVKGVDVPVIVKEVGNGLSAKTIKKLMDLGVKHVDVSGKGGTNFIDIENNRLESKRYDYLKNWGNSTVDALLDTRAYQSKIEVLASGGIRNPLDVIKALALGSKAVGLSRFFLDVVHRDDQTLDYFIEDLKKIMVLVDARTIKDLKNIDIRKPLD